MKKATRFGNFLRSFRQNRGETLSDMSKKIGYTSSYISDIELGHRKIPPNFPDEMEKGYEMTSEELTECRRNLYLCSGQFKIEAKTPVQRVFAGLLKEKLSKMPDETCEAMYKIMTDAK